MYTVKLKTKWIAQVNWQPVDLVMRFQLLYHHVRAVEALLLRLTQILVGIVRLFEAQN